MQEEKQEVNLYALTQEEIEEIAERGAARAYKKMTTNIFIFVGKGILEKLFYIVGLVAVALFVWLHDKGIFK